VNFVKLFEIHHSMKIVPVYVKPVLFPLSTDSFLLLDDRTTDIMFIVWVWLRFSLPLGIEKMVGEWEEILSCLPGNLFCLFVTNSLMKNFS